MVHWPALGQHFSLTIHKGRTTLSFEPSDLWHSLPVVSPSTKRLSFSVTFSLKKITDQNYCVFFFMNILTLCSTMKSIDNKYHIKLNTK